MPTRLEDFMGLDEIAEAEELYPNAIRMSDFGVPAVQTATTPSLNEAMFTSNPLNVERQAISGRPFRSSTTESAYTNRQGQASMPTHFPGRIGASPRQLGAGGGFTASPFESPGAGGDSPAVGDMSPLGMAIGNDIAGNMAGFGVTSGLSIAPTAYSAVQKGLVSRGQAAAATAGSSILGMFNPFSAFASTIGPAIKGQMANQQAQNISLSSKESPYTALGLYSQMPKGFIPTAKAIVKGNMFGDLGAGNVGSLSESPMSMASENQLAGMSLAFSNPQSTQTASEAAYQLGLLNDLMTNQHVPPGRDQTPFGYSMTGQEIENALLGNPLGTTSNIGGMGQGASPGVSGGGIGGLGAIGPGNY